MLQDQPKFHRSHSAVFLILLALLAACTPVIRPTAVQSTAAATPAVANVRQVLTQQLHADAAAVAVMAAAKEEWSDACLGAGRANEACAQVQTPGYQITLSVAGKEYRYHTNADGSDFRLVDAPAPASGERVLTWTSNDERGCQTLEAGLAGVAFGPCLGTLLGVPYSVETRQPDLTAFADEYQSFTAETTAGTLDFVGKGDKTATAAEQRMIAEWARLVALEAQGGRSGASWGLVFAWHREGGLAGFCDDVTVYVSGDAYVTSCKGSQPQDQGRLRLSSNQLTSLYDWVDTLQPFEVAQSDPAVADAMTTHIVFSGAGNAAANDAVHQAITDLALTLITEATTAVTQPSLAEADTAPARCLPATTDQQPWIDRVNGYCLLYPADYVAVNMGENTEEHTVNFVKGSIMNHVDPRVAVTVADAAGRTLDEVADELATRYGLPGTPVERTSITVDGLAAIVLDNLPGQDLNRRVALIRNGRLYSFFFAPLSEPGQDSSAMAAFYQGVLDSMRFLADTNPLPLPAPAAGAVITTAVPFIQTSTNVNLRSGPGTNYGIVGKLFAGQTAQVTGVTADNNWWRVICPDGSVGNCFVVNDPRFVQPTTAPGENHGSAPTPAPSSTPVTTTVPVTDTGEAIIESVEVHILAADPVQIEAVVRGQLPDACSFIQDVSVAVEGNVFNIRLTTARQLAQRCIQVLTPFEQVVRLGSPEPATGNYEVHVGAVVESFKLGE